MKVRRAGIGDEAVLRELRLQALTDAPDAFGSTYERELTRTVEDWRRWLSPGAAFILDDGHAARGLVACARDATAPTIVDLMAMTSALADAQLNKIFRASASGSLTVRDTASKCMVSHLSGVNGVHGRPG